MFMSNYHTVGLFLEAEEIKVKKDQNLCPCVA